MPKPSAEDVRYLAKIRANVDRFMRAASGHIPGGEARLRLLDIAPQDHPGARPYFPARVRIDTLDIDPAAGATYTADICADNSGLIRPSFYDFVVCTEVLEHTLRPFDAVKEIRRLLKRGGKLFLSVPFNFRIHGPLPDCWRFTEHGLRALFSEGFRVLALKGLRTPGRPLMPMHYTVIVEKR